MDSATTSEIRTSAVAGFVKGGKSNKDGSVTFKVSKMKFVLSENSIFAARLRRAKRALLCYEIIEGNRNPKVKIVFIDPSVQLIRGYMEK